MFTGIIEEMGKVKELRRTSQQVVLTVQARKILEDIKIGDSIAVNGTCLTVVDFQKNLFSMDVAPETLTRTNLGALKTGHFVNLERSLRLDSRLGGHLVTGHVDGAGKILSKVKKRDTFILKIQFPPRLQEYLVPQGSIAIDGVSLTVVEVLKSNFSVSIIPHTAQATTLGAKGPGAKVNLETDLIGKYVKRLLDSRSLNAKNLFSLPNHGGIRNAFQFH